MTDAERREVIIRRAVERGRNTFAALAKYAQAMERHRQRILMAQRMRDRRN